MYTVNHVNDPNADVAECSCELIGTCGLANLCEPAPTLICHWHGGPAYPPIVTWVHTWNFQCGACASSLTAVGPTFCAPCWWTARSARGAHEFTTTTPAPSAVMAEPTRVTCPSPRARDSRPFRGAILCARAQAVERHPPWRRRDHVCPAPRWLSSVPWLYWRALGGLPALNALAGNPSAYNENGKTGPRPGALDGSCDIWQSPCH